MNTNIENILPILAQVHCDQAYDMCQPQHLEHSCAIIVRTLCEEAVTSSNPVKPLQLQAFAELYRQAETTDYDIIIRGISHLEFALVMEARCLENGECTLAILNLNN